MEDNLLEKQKTTTGPEVTKDLVQEAKDKEEYFKLLKMTSLKGSLLGTPESKEYEKLSEEEKKKTRERLTKLQEKLGYGSLKKAFMEGKDFKPKE